jgi:plasmid stabilization system protein ParE
VIHYSFHPEAEAELASAVGYYESRMAGLGKSFAAEVERTVSLIRERPNVGSPFGSGWRRLLVRQFPYSIVYVHAAESVLVVAVAHHRRRPGWWRHRA